MQRADEPIFFEMPNKISEPLATNEHHRKTTMGITVLLASYKGEKYITAQLESILSQASVRSELLISDDVSAQDCVDFIESQPSLAMDVDKITVVDGPRAGVNANFTHLIQSAGLADGMLYAYSDQDDVWLDGKLHAASVQLAALASTGCPRLYAGRTMVCDEELNHLFLSKGMPRAASFANALLESIAGGNTMVFDSATLALLKRVGLAVHHDWLTYMVVTACGGAVVFDDTPYVLYRQHGGNVIGANKGWWAKLYRLRRLLGDEFYGWATDNIKALSPIRSEMTAANRQVFDGFIELHEMRGWHRCFARLFLFNRLGLNRQRRLEHFGFMLAAFLGKV